MEPVPRFPKQLWRFTLLHFPSLMTTDQGIQKGQSHLKASMWNLGHTTIQCFPTKWRAGLAEMRVPFCPGHQAGMSTPLSLPFPLLLVGNAEA